MKGDFSRDTFDPRKHYTRVLMQQGRVQLDSDQREEADIVMHCLRSFVRDLIGPRAAVGDAFRIIMDPATKMDQCHAIRTVLSITMRLWP